MPPARWVVIISLANVFLGWMFFHLDVEEYPVASRVGLGVWWAVCIGPFWMLYDWFFRRKKDKWKAWMWLFFVPGGFLWYYFESYRPSKTRERTRS